MTEQSPEQYWQDKLEAAEKAAAYARKMLEATHLVDEPKLFGEEE